MAFQLDIQRVFGAPLGSKALSLLSFASGAITLLPVFPVIRMAFRAMDFLRVNVGDTAAILHGVLVRRNGLKMLRINTGRVAANVVYNHSVRNRAIYREPSYTMGAPTLSPQVEGSVSILIKRALPNMAPTAVNLNLGAKAIGLVFGKIHSAFPSLRGQWVTWPAGECNGVV